MSHHHVVVARECHATNRSCMAAMSTRSSSNGRLHFELVVFLEIYIIAENLVGRGLRQVELKHPFLFRSSRSLPRQRADSLLWVCLKQSLVREMKGKIIIASEHPRPYVVLVDLDFLDLLVRTLHFLVINLVPSPLESLPLFCPCHLLDNHLLPLRRADEQDLVTFADP